MMNMNISDHSPEPEALEPPFVGRHALYARLQQHILDPAQRRAAVVLGGRGMGKSALLWHLDRTYDDSIIGVYFALDLTNDDEDAWLTRLMRRTGTALTQKDFNTTRLVEQPPDPLDGSTQPISSRDWLRNHYLADALRLMRPHRHLVWLFDDADYLLDHLPEDHIHYLHDLLMQHPQLHIIMTLSVDNEQRLPHFAPLVESTRTERLPMLLPEDSTSLVRQYAPGADDALAAAAHRLTGGHPLIAQTFGEYLQEQWQADMPIPPQEAHRQARNATYRDVVSFFEETWQLLNRNERLVLTALSNLLYEDPQRTIGATTMEQWLVETDYPTDLTTIHAALRSLAYRDLIIADQDHIRLAIGLWQSWLLEHARLESAITASPERNMRLANTLMLIVILVAIGVVLVFLVLNNSLAPSTTSEVLPTVTLNSS